VPRNRAAVDRRPASGLGLRVGIYSSPGPTTCAGFAGSAGFEAEDAGSFAAWGFDYLKYDWCSAGPMDDATPLDTLIAPYARMRDALDRVERDIVYHVCQYGFGEVWAWGASRSARIRGGRRLISRTPGLP
jgi:hypothetical protein